MKIDTYWKSDEQRRITDPGNETVVFESGYLKDSMDCGWFCAVKMNGLCVEDFGITKRAALRKARKAWRDANDKGYEAEHGYPRVLECE